MAIYHLSVKTISRSAGRSATAAAAYRAGVEIADDRTGEIHDYTRKSGVVSSDILLPDGAPEWAADRAALWNAAEQSERRKNSTVAREFEIALPSEFDTEGRRSVALAFARELVKRHGCAADVCIHEPSRGGDDRNHHAHILLTTRRLGPDGFVGKTRELDDQMSGEIVRWRKKWADGINRLFERVGLADRIDHRSHADRGLLPEAAGVHLGPAATAIERKGRSSRRGEANRSVASARSAVIGAVREARQVDAEIDVEEKRLREWQHSVAQWVATATKEGRDRGYVTLGMQRLQERAERGETVRQYNESLRQRRIAPEAPEQPRAPDKSRGR